MKFGIKFTSSLFDHAVLVVRLLFSGFMENKILTQAGEKIDFNEAASIAFSIFLPIEDRFSKLYSIEPKDFYVSLINEASKFDPSLSKYIESTFPFIEVLVPDLMLEGKTIENQALILFSFVQEIPFLFELAFTLFIIQQFRLTETNEASYFPFNSRVNVRLALKNAEILMRSSKEVN